MKIALIVPGGVDRTGRERVIPVVLNLIERLARRHTVLVIALEHEREWCRYRLLGAQVVNLGRTVGFGRAARWVIRLQGLLAALRAEGGNFDVLHAIWIRGSGGLAAAAGRLLRVPVVASVGGGELISLPEIDYGGGRSWVGRLESSLVMQSVQAVTGGSRYALRPCTARRPDAVWLPLGVDTSLFSEKVERCPGPPWRLLHVASINKVKDQQTLIRAMRLVRQRNPRVELDCIGTDTLGNRLQQASADLEGQVRFLDFRPLDAVVPFYRRAHLHLQSSLHESMGAAVLEAGAAGVPTVGTAVGLVREMAPSAALAVPQGDAEALADGIITLLADEERRRRLGRAAQEFSRAYDADWTAAQFEALYAKISRRS